MNTNLIKSRLESEGYYVVVSADEVLVGKFRETDPVLGMDLYDAYCSVFEGAEGKLIVDYSNAALPKEAYFTSDIEAVSFIKKTFPL